MKKIIKSVYVCCILLLGICVLVAAALAEGPEKYQRKKSREVMNTTGYPLHQMLNINNFTTWYRADGESSVPPSESYDGGVYPRGTRWVIYMDGIVWGGKAFLDASFTQPAPTQVIRIGGQTYNVGTIEGRIIGTGADAVAADRGGDDVRIYRIRRDYLVMSAGELKRDAAEWNEILVADVTQEQIDVIVNQYGADWDEWPVEYGAPFIERNGVAGYQKPPAFNYDASKGPLFTIDSLIGGLYDEPGLAGADPNSPADQVLWTVYNDLDPTATLGLYGCEPLGLETQVTIWGYKRTDALGNLYFKKIKIINKGGVDIGGGAKGSFYIDSMYIAQWSDPDLGAFGDDLTGCDSLLSLGFIYNGTAIDAEFKKFNIPPPAAGYDYLQGPIVPGELTDTAVFDLKRIGGFKNLGLTSFAYFSAGSGISDPDFDREGGLRWWKMLQGYIPDASTAPNQLYPHPPGYVETKFPLSGDPVNRTGFYDGQGTSYSFAPGDRRIVLNSGPFTLAPGDTQEIVVGTVGGLGSDRLSSVAVMKFNDRFVQNTYNALFQVPKPPASPNVKVTELNGEIILEWGSDEEKIHESENVVKEPGSYKFEGYNVYQLPSSGSLLNSEYRIATYDLLTDPTVVLDEQFDQGSGQILKLPVQFGSNNGVKRFFQVKRDYVRDIDKLNNGQEYYFVVTAYSVAAQEGFLPAALESDARVLIARPKIPYEAVYHDKLGDTLEYKRITGKSDGYLIPIVIDPEVSTGHTYKVTFRDTLGSVVWDLRDTTTNNLLVYGNSKQGDNEDFYFLDGIQLKVISASRDFKSLECVATGNGPTSPDLNTADWYRVFSPGVADAPEQAQGGYFFLAEGGGSGSHASFLARVFRNDDYDRAISNDYEILFTEAGGKAYFFGDVIDVPFEVWYIGSGTPDDSSDDVRCIPWINDEDENGVWDFHGDHPASSNDNDPYSDWIYIYVPNDYKTNPGTVGYDNFVTLAGQPSNLGGPNAYDDVAGENESEHMARLVLMNWNTYAPGPPEVGSVYRIVMTKPNSVLDQFTFTAPAPSKGITVERAGIDRIRVFPNPYYAYNAAEISRFQKFVTFNNLPPSAKLRIFNLAGQLVRVLDKDDPSQFLRWDLNNEDNFPVASGIYIAYLELTLPSTGEVVTKILKVAIIQEQEVPEVF